MNPNREEALFAAALKRPAEKRADFLDGACLGDAALRERVEALLAAHEQPATELGEACESTVKADEGIHELDEAVGQTLGRYKLLERVGEGGCGVVYVAEQTEPVRRRVALKVIKLGMDTKQVVARFEAERQALAMMDHPNIAKVLDAGTIGASDSQLSTPNSQLPPGRPYFVMELVRGIRITDYCDQANLTTKERLDLFIKVCQAIQHAHQKGIIHRDIKPSNILVTLHDGVPVPKVIDFGIAKATEGRLTDNTVYTQLHQFIGTPAYMSPEQAEMSGLDIDTRRDIYSLGVLLYELLAGSTPFDAKELMASGIDAMRKTIREKEPQRPSTRLATLGADQLTTTAKRRSADTSKLLHQLKGDLDWIVMKCLEKDRQRRYDTANGLAADLKRHLNNEPVTARPPSTAYRFQKAFRRNKLVFAAGTAVAIALVAGLCLAALGWRQTRVERDNAKAALQFIQEDVLSQASPGYQPDRELTVRALLDRIAVRLDGVSKRPPLVEASIRQTLGTVYTELGDYPKAVEHYESALRVQREHLGDSHLDTLRSLNGLATARWWGGETSLAEPLTRQGLAASQQALGEKDPLTLQFMQTRAFVLMLLAETPWTEGEAIFLRTLALHREVLGADDPATLRLIYGLSLGYIYHFQPAKAEPLLVDALDRARRALGEKHPTTSSLTTLLAVDYLRLNQLEKAEALALRAVELRRSTLGEDHPLTLSSVSMLANTYVMQHQFDKARPLTEEVLNLSRRLPLERSVFLAPNFSALGWNYLEQGDVAQADILCGLAWQAMRRNPAFNPVVSPGIIAQLGAVRLAQQNYAEATPLLREALRLTEKHDLDAGWRFYVMSLLGASLSGQKNYADAEPLLLQSCQGLQQRQASLSPHLNAPRRIKESLERLVQLYDAWGKPAPAAEWKQKLAAFQQANKAVEKKEAQP